MLVPVLLGVFMGCMSKKTPTQPEDAGVVVACGKTFTGKAGDLFSLSLNANPSTGYAWYPTEESKAIAVQVNDGVFKSSNTDPMVVGAGGTQTLPFKVVKSGEVVVEYRRSWEKEVSPAETCRVTVQLL
ncbi:MAG: protease inhibitor I42 family protein [Bacteroidetes Order II. Incertae sedis bacterium]|nr:protease inhibitor I42 family protein [Bacteroidetes Order II. bacterium]